MHFKNALQCLCFTTYLGRYFRLAINNCLVLLTEPKKKKEKTRGKRRLLISSLKIPSQNDLFFPNNIRKMEFVWNLNPQKVRYKSLNHQHSINPRKSEFFFMESKRGDRETQLDLGKVFEGFDRGFWRRRGWNTPWRDSFRGSRRSLWDVGPPPPPVSWAYTPQALRSRRTPPHASVSPSSALRFSASVQLLLLFFIIWFKFWSCREVEEEGSHANGFGSLEDSGWPARYES